MLCGLMSRCWTPTRLAVAGRVAGLVEEIDGAGQLVHVAEQLVAGQAGQALRLALAEPVHQALVAQRHGDHQAVLDLRTANWTSSRWGWRMLRMTSSARCSGPACVGVEADELQRDADAAGRVGLPDLAEPALAQPADQPVAGNGLGADLQTEGHGDLRKSPRWLP